MVTTKAPSCLKYFDGETFFSIGKIDLIFPCETPSKGTRTCGWMTNFNLVSFNAKIFIYKIRYLFKVKLYNQILKLKEDTERKKLRLPD